MANVSFRLNRPKDKNGELKKSPVAILVAYYHEGIEVELSTGQRTLPSRWNGSRIKGDTGTLINKHLNELESTLLNAHLVHKVSKPELEAIVRRIIKGETESIVQKKTFLETVQQFIAQYEKEKDTGTVKRYRALLKKLDDFSKIYPISFETLDFNFYDAFKVYLYGLHNPLYSGFSAVYNSDLECYDVLPDVDRQRVGEPIGLFDEVVFKYFVNLKTICRWAEKRGVEVHPAYKGWEIIKRQYPPITLDKDELERLENYQFDSKQKHLDIARDYLSLECRTGQRISDLRRFKREDLQDGVWTFFQKKGNRIKAKLIELPLDGFAAPALVILQKYRYELPRISEQKLNENIKKACEKAGISGQIFIERWAGNKKIRISGPKHEFISTHCGKRSFITILAGEGIPVSILSLLTGTSQRTIEKHYLGRIQVSKVRDHLKKVETNQSIMRKHG